LFTWQPNFVWLITLQWAEERGRSHQENKDPRTLPLPPHADSGESATKKMKTALEAMALQLPEDLRQMPSKVTDPNWLDTLEGVAQFVVNTKMRCFQISGSDFAAVASASLPTCVYLWLIAALS
jgi:hypothetical protein